MWAGRLKRSDYSWVDLGLRLNRRWKWVICFQRTHSHQRKKSTIPQSRFLCSYFCATAANPPPTPRSALFLTRCVRLRPPLILPFLCTDPEGGGGGGLAGPYFACPNEDSDWDACVLCVCVHRWTCWSGNGCHTARCHCREFSPICLKKGNLLRRFHT